MRLGFALSTQQLAPMHSIPKNNSLILHQTKQTAIHMIATHSTITTPKNQCQLIFLSPPLENNIPLVVTSPLLEAYAPSW
jgi:hypothetical protein